MTGTKADYRELLFEDLVRALGGATPQRILEIGLAMEKTRGGSSRSEPAKSFLRSFLT
jgi:hypothetical protein